MRYVPVLFALIASLLLSPDARAQGPMEPARLFAEANARFAEALRAGDGAEPRAHFAEAIARWRAIVNESGIRSAKLFANLGNAYLLSGDVGRAVASYRRGERLDATDPAIRDGLAAARRQSGAAASVPAGLSERALAWSGYLPRRALLWVFASLWIAGWIVIFARLMGASLPRRLGAALLAVGALAASPLLAAEVLELRTTHAVVVRAQAPAYNGPSEAIYEPTFSDGLPAGTEVRLLEHRGEWTRVRLGDGRETWVQGEALEMY